LAPLPFALNAKFLADELPHVLGDLFEIRFREWPTFLPMSRVLRRLNRRYRPGRFVFVHQCSLRDFRGRFDAERHVRPALEGALGLWF